MSEFLFDLKKPEESWKGVSYSKRADGSVGSTVGSILPPEGPRWMFWVLDTVMHAHPEGTDFDKAQMPHYHNAGYETFFVDSGKLWLYINGQKALAQKGDIIQLMAGQNHGMGWIEDVKWRGTYHDLLVPSTTGDVRTLLKHMPELEGDAEVKALDKGMDHEDSEPFVCVEVPTEQCQAIKNPSRPHATYSDLFEGVTLKTIVERWENGGAKEMILAELQPGFTAEWCKYPNLHEVFYLRKGKIKFKVYNEEFIADDECVINIPRFAPHSFEVLEPSDLYDMGGQTWWSLFFQDVQSIKKYDPARLTPETMAKLKERYHCNIASIGMKK